MKEKFEDILDKATRHLGSESDLEDFLKRYPEARKELLPLLEAAKKLSEIQAPTLSAESREELRRKLLAVTFKEVPRRWRGASAPKWARRVALSFSAVLLLGTGVAAASRSLPNDLLYPVKHAGERVRLAVSTNKETRARLQLIYAERRLEESRAVVGHPRALHQAITEMSSETSAAVESAAQVSQEKREDLMAELLALTERQQSVLKGVAASAPEAAQEAIQRAMKNSRRDHQRAVEALTGATLKRPREQSPSPPILQKKSRPAPTISVEIKEMPEPRGKGAPLKDGEE